MEELTQNLPEPQSLPYLPDPSDTIEWQTSEYELKPKAGDWFWAIGLSAIAGATLSAFFGNYLFAIIILLGGGLTIIYSWRAPEVITCSFSPKGVRVNHDFYPYERLSAFWIRQEEEPHELILHVNRPLLPHVHVLLGNLDPEIAQMYLEHYLPEEPHHITVAEILAGHLGF